MKTVHYFTLTLTLTLLLWSLPTSAFHIIGGEITYECLGGGNYRFTMKIYRDCSNPNGDGFDTNAPITIFRGDAMPYTQVDHFYAPIQPITLIPPDASNPCLVLPSNICVQEGIYIFEVNLPESDESYHILYQRCCRNNTITNIQTPAEVGGTFSITLTPLAQSLCNNSPVFNNFPPIVVCANQPLEFDHSASDVDGDQLVYELCAPIKGGGVVGFQIPGDPTSCDGFRPDPGCPPPFDNVDYVPPYSALTPLGGDPLVTIDPITGLITGTPIVQGQFVVGVCVTEYRNGNLLSIIQRDFQFNVAFCEPTVVAKLAADSIVDDKLFIFNSCDDTVNLLNTSFQQSSINEHLWRFDLNGQIFEDNVSWHLPNMVFPNSGIFEGQLLLNPNTVCADTADILVHIFPEIEAGFSFDYDTCVSGPVQFIDLSITPPNHLSNWNWSFGDGEESNVQNPAHVYEVPGFHNVRLHIEDKNGCESELSQLIRYQPVPALIVIAPSTFVGCEPATIFFDNLSSPIDENYEIIWNFGDDGFSEDISPTYVFERPGIYDVTIEITSPIGCQTDTLFPQWITIQPSPIADFSFNPTTLSNLEPTAQFTDQSIDAVHWEWFVNGQLFSQDQHPVYTFPDTGWQEIKLVITHPEKCQDTIVKHLDVMPEITYFMPNAFTPNEDDVNELFMGVGVLRGITDFNLQIWDRWGTKVFETTDPLEGWNGRHQNTGKLLSMGVYVCLVKFTKPRGERFEYRGYATMVR